MGVLDVESEGVAVMVDLEGMIEAELDCGEGYICGGVGGGDTMVMMTVKIASWLAK